MGHMTRRDWIRANGWDPRDPDAIVAFVLEKSETEEDKKAVEVEAHIVAALMGAEPWPV
ncbi:hypothetical protein [Azospirillum sp. sgz302134]